MGWKQSRVWAVAGCGVLLAGLALVAAQAQRPKESGEELTPIPHAGPRVPAPPVRMVPVPATPVPATTVPLSQYPSGFLAPDAAPRLRTTPPTPEVPVINVRLELTNGLCLDGQMVATPLPGLARIGEVAIPPTTIRGLRLHNPPSGGDDKRPAGPTATVILDNDDSLTFELRLQQIQIKTSWGTAIVDLPHVRSLIVAGDTDSGPDSLQWEEAGGRWRLKPVGKIPILTEEEEKLGIDLPQ